jgi:(2Fe-2S) ferredoxin
VSSEAPSHYRQHVFFCCNQREPGGRVCCNDAGAIPLRDYAKAQVKKLGLAGKGRVRINQAGCMERCEEGPCLVVYPDAVWYTYRNEMDIDEIIRSHVQNGIVVERLRLP